MTDNAQARTARSADPVRLARAWVHRNRLGRLATVGPDLAPHAVPVIYAYDHRRNLVVFMTAPGTRKVRNLAANPRVCLVVDDGQTLRGAQVHGTARVVDDGPEFDELQRYLLEQGRITRTRPASEQVVVAVTPTRWTSWGLAAPTRPEPPQSAEPARPESPQSAGPARPDDAPARREPAEPVEGRR